jgi:hypothetical protein
MLLHDAWPDLEFTLSFRRGVVRRVVVEARTASAPPLTTTLLRTPPFGELQRVARDELRGHFKTLAEAERQPADLMSWAADQLGHYEFGRSGRGLPAVRFAQLAARYLELCATSRSPIKDLAAERNEAPATVKNAIYKAREIGFLSETKRGQRGGALTPKAIRALERAAKEEV